MTIGERIVKLARLASRAESLGDPAHREGRENGGGRQPQWHPARLRTEFAECQPLSAGQGLNGIPRSRRRQANHMSVAMCVSAAPSPRPFPVDGLRGAKEPPAPVSATLVLMPEVEPHNARDGCDCK